MFLGDTSKYYSGMCCYKDVFISRSNLYNDISLCMYVACFSILKYHYRSKKTKLSLNTLLQETPDQHDFSLGSFISSLCFSIIVCPLNAHAICYCNTYSIF